MYCKKCGTNVDDDSAFCNKCGVSLAGNETSPITPTKMDYTDKNNLFDIELIDAGIQKLAVIKLMREALSIGLKETKELVDSVPIIIDLIPESDAKDLHRKLSDLGANAVLHRSSDLDNGMDESLDVIEPDSSAIQTQNQSGVPSNRNELLDKLYTARKHLKKIYAQIAIEKGYGKSMQKCQDEINTFQTHIRQLEDRAKAQREKFIGFDWFMLIIYIIIGLSIASIIGGIIAFIGGIFLQSVVQKITFKKRRANLPDKYKKQHANEFDTADAEIERLEKEMNELSLAAAKERELLGSYYNSGEYMDIGTYLPKKYMSANIVSWFIDALESYRADNLKEVINLYEDELHKGRLERMQKEQLATVEKQLKVAHQTAEYAKRTAYESEKAAAYAKETAQNTKETAKYGKKTAKSARYGNVLNTVNTVRHWNDGKNKKR